MKKRRPHLKRAEYDKSVAWIASNAKPDALAMLVAMVADQFGQSAADVSTDVSAAFLMHDVQRGTIETRLMLARLADGAA